MAPVMDRYIPRQRGIVRDLDFVIVGTPRSGTTLVQRLACELRGTRVPPETQFFWRFGPRLLARRTFPLNERAIREEIAAFLDLKSSRGFRLDADAVTAALGGRCDHIVELYSVFVRQLAGEAELYGEKSPQHLMWWRVLTDTMPNLKVIGVVRDPRAVIASTLKVVWNSDSHLLLAERWAFEQRQLLRAQRRLGEDRCLVLRYEDVVTDPLAAKRAMSSFLGAPVSVKPAEIQDRGQIFHPRQTWVANATGPVVVSRVHAWRDELTSSQVADVMAVCRREIRRLGYDAQLGHRKRAMWFLQLPPDDHLRRFRYKASRYRYWARVRKLSRTLPPRDRPIREAP